MVPINFLAVLTAAIVNMVLGFLWYGPIFGKPWAALMKFTPGDMEEAKKKGMAKFYAGNFVATLVMAYVLARFTIIWGAMDVPGALALAAWLWLGFVVTIMIDSILWERKPVKLFLLNIGYRLVSFSVMAVILALWP